MPGRLLVFVCSWFAVTLAVADVPPAQTTSVPTPPKLDDAIKQAASAGKPLVLEFSTDWCHACKIFEKETLPDAGVQSALSDVLFVRYDAEVAPGDEAARRYGVHVFPMFIAVDASGVLRAQQEGAVNASMFVAWLGSVRAATQTELSIRNALAAKPKDADAALGAARWYATRGRAKEAIAQYDRAAKLSTDATKRGEASRASRHLQRVAQWRQTLLADTIAAISRDPAGTSRDELALATVSSGADAKSILAVTKAALDAHADVEELNSLIYVALAAGQYDEALRAGERLVLGRRSAQFLDTLAECHHMRGNKAKALALEDEALGLSQGSPLAAALAQNRKRFESGGDSDDVRQLQARAADLWKRIATGDQLKDRVAVATPAAAASKYTDEMDEMRTFFKEKTAAAEAIGKACRQSAGPEFEAYARIKFDTKGAIIDTAIFLDKSAPKELRPCLAKELATLTFTKVPKRTTRETLTIQFR